MPSTMENIWQDGQSGKNPNSPGFVRCVCVCVPLSVPTPQTYQLSSSQTQTTKEEPRVSGALSTASRNPVGNCDSLHFPAEAIDWQSRLWMGTVPKPVCSVSSSVYIAETRAGLWGPGELPQGPLGRGLTLAQVSKSPK